MVVLEMTDEEARYVIKALNYCAEATQTRSEFINGHDYKYGAELQEIAGIIKINMEEQNVKNN